MTLKPCPFCDSTNLAPSLHNNGQHEFIFIVCNDCEAEGPATICNPLYPASDSARAASKWNTRATRTEGER